MSYTKKMAEFFSQLREEDIPEDLRKLAKLCLLDTLGVILAAYSFLEKEGDERLPKYMKKFDGSPQSTVIGYGKSLPFLVAAFANGTMGEVLDWQDTTLLARIHSGPGTIPALLAVAEWRNLSGRSLIPAIVAGYEAGARVGVAIQPSHWYSGFQATGTIGSIGAAAAIGNLLGFKAQRFADALGIAGFILPISNGDGVFHGYSVKPIHGGMAAQAGVQASLLAESGYESNPLEGLPPRYHGFLNISSKGVKAEELVKGLGKTWLMRNCSHKIYPVGLLNIGPVKVAIDLVRSHDIRQEQIKRIEVKSYKDVVHFVADHPTNPSSSFIDCHLSLPYTIAAAIFDREMGPMQLTRKRIADPAIHKLASVVKVIHDSSMDDDYPAVWPVEMKILLKNGKTVSERLDLVPGCPRRPLTEEELIGKFLGISSPILGVRKAELAKRAILGLETLDSVRDLIRLLMPQSDRLDS